MQTPDKHLAAAIDDRIILGVLLALNAAGFSGWPTFIALALFFGLIGARAAGSRLARAGFSPVRPNRHYAASRRLQAAHRAALVHLRPLRSRLRRANGAIDVALYYGTFILAAMPYGQPIPASFIAGILIAHAAASLAPWARAARWARTGQP